MDNLEKVRSQLERLDNDISFQILLPLEKVPMEMVMTSLQGIYSPSYEVQVMTHLVNSLQARRCPASATQRRPKSVSTTPSRYGSGVVRVCARVALSQTSSSLQLPSHAPKDADTSSPDKSTLSALGAMVQLLPTNYDIGRIPPEVSI